MFDGTDLSMAYGSMYELPQATPQMAVDVPQVHHTAEHPVPKSTASHAMPPDVPYNPPPAMHAQQPYAKISHHSESFWDKLVSKKIEVVKLVVLSLVVLLGISIDKMASHYLNGYIGKAFLSDTQEVLVRLSYPIAVVLVLWIIKASF